MFFTLIAGAGAAAAPAAASLLRCSRCRAIASSRAFTLCTFSLLATPKRFASSILRSSASKLSTLAVSSASSLCVLRFNLFLATSFLRCSLRCASPGANVCLPRERRGGGRDGQRGRKPYRQNGLSVGESFKPRVRYEVCV